MAPSNQNILSIQAFLCSFGDFWLRWLVHMAARRGNFYYAQFCIFTRSSIYFRFYFFFFFCSIAAVDMGFRIYFPLFNILVCFRFHSLYWFGKFCTLHAYLCCDALSPGRYFSLFFYPRDHRDRRRPEEHYHECTSKPMMIISVGWQSKHNRPGAGCSATHRIRESVE